MDGRIQEFTAAVKSGEILGEYSDHFICDSDGIYVGETISLVLGGHDGLQAVHLYFVLPRQKLQFAVTDSDMASLLWKASAALKQNKRKSGGKVQPLFDMRLNEEHDASFPSCHCVAKPLRSRKKEWPAKLETIVEAV